MTSVRLSLVTAPLIRADSAIQDHALGGRTVKDQKQPFGSVGRERPYSGQCRVGIETVSSQKGIGRALVECGTLPQDGGDRVQIGSVMTMIFTSPEIK